MRPTFDRYHFIRLHKVGSYTAQVVAHEANAILEKWGMQYEFLENEVIKLKCENDYLKGQLKGMKEGYDLLKSFKENDESRA